MVHTLAFEVLSGYSPVQRIVTSFPTSATVTTQTPGVSKDMARCVFCYPSFLFTVLATCSSTVYHLHASPPGHHSLTLDLVASHSSSSRSTTPTQASSTAPMLSIQPIYSHIDICGSRLPFVSISRTCQHLVRVARLSSPPLRTPHHRCLLSGI